MIRTRARAGRRAIVFLLLGGATLLLSSPALDVFRTGPAPAPSHAFQTAANGGSPVRNDTLNFPTAANWPTFGSNVARSSVAANESVLGTSDASGLSVAWTNSTGIQTVSGSLAVLDGSVYAGSWSGALFEFSAATGQRIWAINLTGSHHSGTGGSYAGCWQQGGIYSTPTVVTKTVGAATYDTIYVTAGTSYLYAINGSTGSVIWKQDTANYSDLPGGVSTWGYHLLWSSPLVYGGYAYVGLASTCDARAVQGQLLQIPIDGANHTPTHIFDVTGSSGSASDVGAGIWSTPMLDPATNTLWVVTGNENASWDGCEGQKFARAIVALNASNVTDVRSSWQVVDLGCGGDFDFGGAPTLLKGPGGTSWVVAPNKDGTLYAVNEATGKLAWSCYIGSDSFTPIAPGAASGTSFYVTGDGNQDAVSGEVYSVTPQSDGCSLKPLAPTSGGVALAGLTYANGLLVAAYNYHTSSNATVLVLDASTGKVLAKLAERHSINGEPVVSDGRIFYGTGNAYGSRSGSVVALGINLTSFVHLRSYCYANGSSGCPGTSVSATLASSPSGGMPGSNATSTSGAYSCTWDWGDGSNSRGCGETTHVYCTTPTACRGSYVVLYNVSDWAGTFRGIGFSLRLNGSLGSVVLDRSPLRSYPVVFAAVGLPLDTLWSVRLNGVSNNSTTGTIAFSSANETNLSFAVSKVAGYRATPSNGSVTVNGSDQSISIVFAREPPRSYDVTFVAVGLPAALSWTVRLNGTLNVSTTRYVGFRTANVSSLPYSVLPVQGESASPSNGSFSIAGQPVNITIVFLPTLPALFPVTFDESGLPHGTAWSVTFLGESLRSSSDAVTFQTLNGSLLPFGVAEVPGYAASPSNGTLNVSGAGVRVPVVFGPVGPPLSEVTFLEAGLPTGASWSVVMGGTSATSSNSTVRFLEPNGTGYSYAVVAPTGYVSSPSAGIINVSGEAEVTLVLFEPVPPQEYPVTFRETGLPSNTSWSVIFDGAGQAGNQETLGFWASNGTHHSFTVLPVPGYVGSPVSGSAEVAGRSVEVVIGFGAAPAHEYDVTFMATGLPDGSGWSVSLGGTTLSSTSRAIVFSEQNGTAYGFFAGGSGVYVPTPSRGIVSVAGAAVEVSITFVLNASEENPLRITVLTANPPRIELGGSFQLHVEVSGGTPPMTFAYSGLPEGCQPQNTTDLACRPTTAGDATIAVQVSDAEGRVVVDRTSVSVTHPSQLGVGKDRSALLFDLALSPLAVLLSGMALLLAIGGIGGAVWARRRG